MSRRGWVLFAAMSVIWGVSYLFIKVADRGVAVPVVVFARVGLGAAVLLPLAVRRGQFRALLPHWRWLALFATVEMIAPWALLTDAERRLTSSMSGLLIASVPIITILLARITGSGERLGRARWLGLLMGLAGVGLLAGPGALGGGVWPITEIMLTAIGYAAGPLIASRKFGGLPQSAVIAVCLGGATVVYAPAAVLSWPTHLPSVAVLASLVALALVCTAVAFVLFFQLISEAGPARALVITYVNPAVAVVAGVTVLNEPLTLTIMASFVFILAGSVLATQGMPRWAWPRRAGRGRSPAQPAVGARVTVVAEDPAAPRGGTP